MRVVLRWLAAALLAALPVASGAAEPPQEAVAARSFAFEETLDAAFARARDSKNP